MKKIFSLVLLVSLVLVLSSCSKNNTLDCSNGDDTLVIKWNEEDGFVSAVENGADYSDDDIDFLNDTIDQSGYSIERYFEEYQSVIEGMGYTCTDEKEEFPLFFVYNFSFDIMFISGLLLIFDILKIMYLST